MLFQRKHIILSLIICCTFTAHAQKKFELEFCKNGISIYSKTDTNKKHIEYKGSLTLDSTLLKKVTSTLTDYKNHSNWVYNCENSELLKKESSTTYLYQTCHATWPFKNRDYVLRLEKKVVDKNTIKVEFTAVNNYVSDKKEFVRIDEFKGYWEIEKKDSKIVVTMYGDFNPKMNLPQSIMKKYARKISFNTLQNLKQSVIALK